MSTVAQREYLVLALLVGFFIAALIPSLLTTRAAVRDGLRKENITYLKRSLEDFYNQHATYPLPAATCITSTNPQDWNFAPTLPHDVRESKGFAYRYCVTSRNSRGATGYYLEARFEREASDQQAFDEDEQRKFHYRILHANGQTLYRVCGGEEQQCKQDPE